MEAYEAPTVNMKIIGIFCSQSNDKRKISGIGITTTTISSKTLKQAKIQTKMRMLMHFPSCCPSQPFQEYEIGVQLKISTSMNASPEATVMASDV
jgi:hypothetical protein